MERPRPRAKHRSKKRESVPSHTLSHKKDKSRPRPSSKFMKHRISSSHPTRNTITLVESKSPESKEEPVIISDPMGKLNISISTCTITTNKNTKTTKNHMKNNTKNNDILSKLRKIKQHQKTRKSDFGKDFDEIKHFLSTCTQNTYTDSSFQTGTNDSKQYAAMQNKYNAISNKHPNELPTSLQLIGIHCPSSLLYHRQFDRQYVDKIHHHRAQSSIVPVNVNKVIADKQESHSPTTLNVNYKYQHLRSYSSIMATDKTHNYNPNDNDYNYKDRNDNILYVQKAKNRKPSLIFGDTDEEENIIINYNENNLKRQKSKKEILQELADEYQSESDDDEDNQDDDLRRGR